MGILFATKDMKKRKNTSASTNEMLSYCTALGFISKNEEYNPE